MYILTVLESTSKKDPDKKLPDRSGRKISSLESPAAKCPVWGPGQLDMKYLATKYHAERFGCIPTGIKSFLSGPFASGPYMFIIHYTK
jgi:hypothetical protein